jgi:hypothetical protein
MSCGPMTRYCPTCKQARLVRVALQVIRRPYTPEGKQTRLVYVCRGCGSTLCATPVAA